MPHPCPDSREAIIWCEPEHDAFVRALAESLSLDVRAMGSPANDHEPIEGAEPIRDMRHALVSTDADLAILTTARASADDPPAGDLLDDAEHLREARARIGSILTTCPHPPSVHLAPIPGEADRAPVRFVPRFASLPAYHDAREAMESFESVRTMALSMRCAPAHGSLGARLLDAMSTIHGVMGVPETVDACVITPEHSAGIHRAPPEHLGALRGDLTANIRFSASRAACLALSDRGGRWFRGVTLVGSMGCVRIDDDAFESIDPEGRTVDSSRHTRGDDAPEDPAVRAVSRGDRPRDRPARLAPGAAGHAGGALDVPVGDPLGAHGRARIPRDDTAALTRRVIESPGDAQTCASANFANSKSLSVMPPASCVESVSVTLL